MSRLEEIKAKPYFNKETRTDRVNSADIVWLINRVEELESNLLKLKQWEFETKPYVKSLEIQNQRYKQALEMYADIDSYVGDIQWIVVDQGSYAREALKVDK